MENTITISDSVIGSLCREVDLIRHRCSYLKNAINNCKNESLHERLQLELKQLASRKIEILKVAEDCEKVIIGDNLSLSFLIELSKRIDQ